MKQLLTTMLSVSVMAGAGDAVAQAAYPEKPIRLVVPFPVGGGVDTNARLLGQKFSEAWGRQVVVENVPGAAGNIAAHRVAKAAPDGYTLGLLGTPQLAINPSLYALAYDPVKDFAPVSQVTRSPFILVVHNAVPAKSVRELVALVKARPGELAFASSGSGAIPHMAAELLKSIAGLDIRHIPYKGVSAAMPDLLGGRVTMMFSPMVVVLPHAQERKLRALAVTSLKRSPAAPEVPTVAESGYPGFDVWAWTGLLAPANTPATIVSKVHLETVKTLAVPDMRAKFAELGTEVTGNSPQEFAAAIRSEIPKWAKVVRESGIKPD
jgi:tripartite-type tricarboxylate transporter receptor subunit TctC